ncbi:MAG: hypothetical protein ABIQ31_19525 [Ferruginibacter sp.]
MKKILILYPHFPPSNLAGVHRPRLFAQHLPSFGWEPVILTVHENYYEEALDWNLHKLLPEGLRIEKVDAFNTTRPRIVGDIGLRAFFQLYKRAKKLIQTDDFDFLYLPIPSFYCALLGRWLHSTTGIKYGIDYIDPWVHHFPGSDKVFSRHWLSTKIARFLEPIAVKKASLITGVAEGYYKDVLSRNPHLKNQAVVGAMPYGGEITDHSLVAQLNIKAYLFQKKSGKLQIVYAGAMLPKAYKPLEAIFQCMQQEPGCFKNVEFHFIGTGHLANGIDNYNIKPLAIQYGLWETIVYEYPKRIPYLDVLVHLDQADGIFILGSTEPHYTPSKTYQAVLAKKAVLAVLHVASTGINVLQKSKAGIVLDFDGEEGIEKIKQDFTGTFLTYKSFAQSFNSTDVDLNVFREYSASKVTGKLALLLEQATG